LATLVMVKKIQACSIPLLLLMYFHERLLDGRYQHVWLLTWSWTHWLKQWMAHTK